MELFSAAGIDLPSTDGSKARRGRALTKALHVPLFNYKVVAEARSRGAKVFSPSEAQVAAAADYARKIKDGKFLHQKEMAVRDILVQDVIQTVLGYRPYDPAKPYSLARERPIRGGAVDVALGNFNLPDGADEIVAPFELKGPDRDDAIWAAGWSRGTNSTSPPSGPRSRRPSGPRFR